MPTYNQHGLHVLCSRYWDRDEPGYCATFKIICYTWIASFSAMAVLLQAWIYRNTAAAATAVAALEGQGFLEQQGGGDGEQGGVRTEDQEAAVDHSWDRFVYEWGPPEDEDTPTDETEGGRVTDRNEPHGGDPFSPEAASSSNTPETLRFMWIVFMAQIDYVSDTYYIGTSEFASPLLIVTAVAIYCVPLATFVVQFWSVVVAHFKIMLGPCSPLLSILPWAGLHELHRRCSHSKWDEFYKVAMDLVGMLVFIPSFCFLAAVQTLLLLPFFPLIIVWWVGIYLFVECKLHIMPKFASAVFLFGSEPSSRKASLDDGEMNLIFNSLLVSRTFASGLPQLVLVILNTLLLRKQAAYNKNDDETFSRGNFALYFQVGTSLLMVLTQIWPVGYSIYENGSVAAGMRNRQHPGLRGTSAPDYAIRLFDALRDRAQQRAAARMLVKSLDDELGSADALGLENDKEDGGDESEEVLSEEGTQEKVADEGSDSDEGEGKGAPSPPTVSGDLRAPLLA